MKMKRRIVSFHRIRSYLLTQEKRRISRIFDKVCFFVVDKLDRPLNLLGIRSDDIFCGSLININLFCIADSGNCLLAERKDDFGV